MIDKYVVKLILEIEELALNISSNTEHDVIFNYSGHVQNIDIRYYKNGWKEDKKGIKILDMYLDLSKDPEKELIEAEKFLINLLGENKWSYMN